MPKVPHKQVLNNAIAELQFLRARLMRLQAVRALRGTGSYSRQKVEV